MRKPTLTFAVLSAVVMLTAVLVISYAHRLYTVNQVGAMAERNNAALAQIIANATLPDFQAITSANEAGPRAGLRRHRRQSRLRRSSRQGLEADSQLAGGAARHSRSRRSRHLLDRILRRRPARRRRGRVPAGLVRPRRQPHGRGRARHRRQLRAGLRSCFARPGGRGIPDRHRRDRGFRRARELSPGRHAAHLDRLRGHVLRADLDRLAHQPRRRAPERGQSQAGRRGGAQRSRQPVEKRLPCRHEPRAAHALERRHRLLGDHEERAVGPGGGAGLSGLRHQHSRLGHASLVDRQRHPRHGQDRDRQRAARSRGIRHQGDAGADRWPWWRNAPPRPG